MSFVAVVESFLYYVSFSSCDVLNWLLTSSSSSLSLSLSLSVSLCVDIKELYNSLGLSDSFFREVKRVTVWEGEEGNGSKFCFTFCSTGKREGHLVLLYVCLCCCCCCIINVF